MNDKHNLKITRLFLAALAALTLTACGGAEVGEECDEPGSSDECVDSAVCTNEDGVAVCRQTCLEQEECPALHQCNGVSGTSIKSCQPDAK